jgi:hypothetical protein
MKLAPFTVRVNVAPPVLAEGGESEVMDGTGFGGGGGGLEDDDEPTQADSPRMASSGIRQI